MKKEGSRIRIISNGLRCCKNKPVLEVIYDVGTEGERKYFVCSVHIKKKPFNMHIKSQKPIGDSNE